VSLVRSTHSLKFGFYGERIREYEGEQGTYPGQFDFGRDVNNPNDSNYAYSNAILGNFTSYSESTARNGDQRRGATLEWYAQDHWKVTRKLTLDYGMRLSYFIPDYWADNKAVNLDPSRYDASKRVRLFEPALNAQGQRVARNPITSELLPVVFIGDVVNGAILQGTADYPRSFQDSRGIQWGPRFGFAYDPFGDGKTAIRGGGGIFYNNRFRPGSLNRNPPSQFTPFLYYDSLTNYINTGSTLFPSGFSAIARSGEVPTVYNLSVGSSATSAIRP
jgi:hypothetical protein